MNAPALNLNGKRCSGTVFLCTHMSTLCWNSHLDHHMYIHVQSEILSVSSGPNP